jgi:hypothetical protein
MITTEDELLEDVLYWKGRADEAKATLDEALGIIHDLLGLEFGSSDRALEFLYRHTPTAEDVRGILAVPNGDRT